MATVRAVHFQRNVLSHVSAKAIGEIAKDLKAIFTVRRENTAHALAEEFVELSTRRTTRRLYLSSKQA